MKWLGTIKSATLTPTPGPRYANYLIAWERCWINSFLSTTIQAPQLVCWVVRWAWGGKAPAGLDEVWRAGAHQDDKEPLRKFRGLKEPTQASSSRVGYATIPEAPGPPPSFPGTNAGQSCNQRPFLPWTLRTFPFLWSNRYHSHKTISIPSLSGTWRQPLVNVVGRLKYSYNN